MELLQAINRHIRATGTPPSRFGREAAGDPGLVRDLRRGRRPGAALTARVLAYIARREAA